MACDGVTYALLALTSFIRFALLFGRQIHTVHKDEQLQRGNPNPKVLAADDCFPIVVWCVVHSRLDRPFATLQLLQALCNPDKRMSEIGYVRLLAAFLVRVCHPAFCSSSLSPDHST